MFVLQFFVVFVVVVVVLSVCLFWPWKRIEIILVFLTLHPNTAFWTLLLTMMATPFF